MKYSATSRLGEGVEMSKQLSQQTGRSCSSSYRLVNGEIDKILLERIKKLKYLSERLVYLFKISKA